MQRSLWKLPFISSGLFKKRIYIKNYLKFGHRNCLVTRLLVDKRVRIHNGVWFLGRDIVANMIGLKLGELSFTRRCDGPVHLKKKTKKRTKSKK